MFLIIFTIPFKKTRCFEYEMPKNNEILRLQNDKKKLKILLYIKTFCLLYSRKVNPNQK